MSAAPLTPLDFNTAITVSHNDTPIILMAGLNIDEQMFRLLTFNHSVLVWKRGFPFDGLTRQLSPTAE